MSLVRTNSPLGKLIIRKLGDVGGPRSDLVDAELDNIIAWAKVSPRRIRFDTSVVGNVGLGLDVLHTFSLPANSLQVDGDELDAVYAGTFAANDNDKRVNLFFGGTAYEPTGTLDIDGGSWRAVVRIIRLSSTSVRVSSFMSYFGTHIDSANAVNSFGVGGLFLTRNQDITALANLNSNATTMEVKGETLVNVNDDVKQNYSSIYLTQQ